MMAQFEKKTRRRDPRNIKWMAAKDITINNILKAGAQKTCQDMISLAGIALLDGLERDSFLGVGWLTKWCNAKQLNWLERKGFIVEDKEALYKDTISLLQEMWEKNERVYANQHNTVNGIRSSQIAALVDMLIKLEIIDERRIEQLKNKLFPKPTISQLAEADEEDEEEDWEEVDDV